MSELRNSEQEEGRRDGNAQACSTLLCLEGQKFYLWTDLIFYGSEFQKLIMHGMNFFFYRKNTESMNLSLSGVCWFFISESNLIYT